MMWPTRAGGISGWVAANGLRARLVKLEGALSRENVIKSAQANNLFPAEDDLL